MRGLHDKVVLVTGGTSGIGRACVQRLAAEGCRVVFTGRDEGRARETIEAAGECASFVAADARSVADCEAAVAETLRRHGGLDRRPKVRLAQRIDRELQADLVFDCVLLCHKAHPLCGWSPSILSPSVFGTSRCGEISTSNRAPDSGEVRDRRHERKETPWLTVMR